MTECYQAAMEGNLDLLKHLHEQGQFWDAATCANAALGGHLQCLKYAHEKGCPWESSTCENAAMCGHFECLQYAVENGCEWNLFTVLYTTFCQNLNCFRYLYIAWSDKNSFQSFWTEKYNFEKLSPQIDLDDSWWRHALFTIDLSSHPILQERLNAKKEEIEEQKCEINKTLSGYLIKDILQYGVNSYL